MRQKKYGISCHQLFLQNKAFFKLYLFWLWKCCNNKKFMCMSNIETFCNNWWRFYLGSVHDASILCHAIEDGLPANEQIDKNVLTQFCQWKCNGIKIRIQRYIKSNEKITCPPKGRQGSRTLSLFQHRAQAPGWWYWGILRSCWPR